MKAVRWLHLLPLVTFLLSSAVVFTPFADAQKIRALLVADDSADSVYAKNVNEIFGLLKTLKDKEVGLIDTIRFDSTSLSDTPISERVDSWLRNLQPAGNDTIFLYYSRPDASGDDEPVDLNELSTKMGEMPCRLKILITDADINYIEGVDETDASDMSDVSASALRNLFVQHKGLLHLTGKSKGEFAFGDANGGWFTQTLVGAIRANPESDEDDSIVTWEKVLKEAQKGTQELYKKHSANFSDDIQTAMDVSDIKKSQTPTSVLEKFPILSATVHALLVIADTAAADEKSVGDLNHRKIQGLLRGARDHGICDVEIQSLMEAEAAMSSDKITEWVEALQPRENDTVLIYYSGKDGGDQASQDEFLKALDKAVKNKNAKKSRLQMLIVDTYRFGPGIIGPRFSLPYPQTTFHNLFLQHKGLLYLASRAEAELAFGDSFDGGWFTRALVDSIYEIRDREDFPVQVPDNGRQRKFLEWEELIEDTRERTRELFEESYLDGFKDPDNYPSTFSEDKRNKLVEELEGLDRGERRKIQTPKVHDLPQPLE